MFCQKKKFEEFFLGEFEYIFMERKTIYYVVIFFYLGCGKQTKQDVQISLEDAINHRETTIVCWYFTNLRLSSQFPSCIPPLFLLLFFSPSLPPAFFSVSNPYYICLVYSENFYVSCMKNLRKMEKEHLIVWEISFSWVCNFKNSWWNLSIKLIICFYCLFLEIFNFFSQCTKILFFFVLFQVSFWI